MRLYMFFKAVHSIRGYFYSQEEIRDMLDAVKDHEHADSDRAQHDDTHAQFHIHLDPNQIESKKFTLTILDIIVLIYCVLISIVLLLQSISEKALYEISVNNKYCIKRCSFAMGIYFPASVLIAMLHSYTYIIFREASVYNRQWLETLDKHKESLHCLQSPLDFNLDKKQINEEINEIDSHRRVHFFFLFLVCFFLVFQFQCQHQAMMLVYEIRGVSWQLQNRRRRFPLIRDTRNFVQIGMPVDQA